MIKNKNISPLWFLVMGLMITTLPSLYAAQQPLEYNFNKFLSSPQLDNSDQISRFINDLKILNNNCLESMPLETSCIQLRNILNKQNKLSTVCEQILTGTIAEKADKRTLAETCFEIKFNPNMTGAESLPLTHLIKDHLSGPYLLNLAIEENNPNTWTGLSDQAKGIKSLEAITTIDNIIQNHKLEPIGDNFSWIINRYLQDIAIGLLQSDASEFQQKVEENKQFLHHIAEVADSKNQEVTIDIPSQYTLIKDFIGDKLPSLNVRKPSKKISSPGIVIVTPQEIALLKEKKKTDNIFFHSILNIINVIQTGKKIDESFKYDFETIVYGYNYEGKVLDDDTRTILKKVFESEPFQNALATVRNTFSGTFDTRVKDLFTFLSISSTPSAEIIAPVGEAKLEQKPIATRGITPQTAAAAKKVIQQEPIAKIPLSFDSSSFIPQINGPTPTTYQRPVLQNPTQASATQPATHQPSAQPNQAITFKTPAAPAPFNQLQQPPATKIKSLFTPLSEAKLTAQENKEKREALNTAINDLNTKIKKGKTNEVQPEIEAINDLLIVASPIDKFKIDALFKNLKMQPPSLELSGLYQAPLSKEQVELLSPNIPSAKTLIDINKFFLLGCPNDKVRDFSENVIRLVTIEKEESYNVYIAIIAKNTHFRTICKFIENGPYFKKQREFNDALQALRTKFDTEPIVQIQEIANTTQSILPTAPPLPTLQQPAVLPQGNIQAFKPGRPNPTGAPVQPATGKQPQPTNGQQNNTPAPGPNAPRPGGGIGGAIGALLSGIGSIFSAIGSGIGQFFSYLRSLLS